MKISLEAARINKGLIRKDAAEMLGVSVTTLRNWEKYISSPTVIQAKGICKVYDVELDDISWS